MSISNISSISSYINGSYVQKNQSINSNDTIFFKFNPYTSEKLYSIQSADVLQVVTSIQSAQKFFLEFKNSSYDERKSILIKIKNYLEINSEAITVRESVQQALNKNLNFKWNLKACLFFIDQALNEKNESHFVPTGVITILASWNLSLRNIFENLIPAIAAGNTCIVKVSSHSPGTAITIIEMIQVCQIPNGLIQVVISNDKVAQKALITHPAIKGVVVVGTIQTAQNVIRDISQTSGQSFKKIKIQSGSKNSAIVLSEPDNITFEKVIESFMFGQGQLVWNSARLFILEKYEKIWLEKIKHYLSEVEPAQCIDDPSLWTPIVRHQSFDVFKDVMNQAKADQGQLIQSQTASDKLKKLSVSPESNTLKYPNSDNYLPITFTKDMSNCSTLQQDQISAPLFIISTVKYPFDVPKYSNVSYYGYAAHIYGDPNKSQKMTDSLDVGLITFNKWSIEQLKSFKAVKQSGYGLQDSRVFGDFFSNAKILTN